jgi:hypothetical protein
MHYEIGWPGPTRNTPDQEAALAGAPKSGRAAKKFPAQTWTWPRVKLAWDECAITRPG